MPESVSPVANPVKLRSLAPSYNEGHHGVYVSALIRALRDQDDVRNIALTGAYGTGKSSVLQHLTEMDNFKDRVLELSLSTVGVVEERPSDETETNPAAWTKANLIQKEIVKQILYRDSPEKTRGSRFHRLSQFQWKTEIGIAFSGAAVALAVMWAVGLAAPLMRPLGPTPALGWFALANVMLLMALVGVVYSVRWATHNRIFLEKLSAGPATVSLTATSSSYFDQYVDEIVYYFEKSGRDIVIFEDIDRFEDVHIFEALRALNTLLNGAEQVRRRRLAHGPARDKARQRPDIKFIYALRDSVFEKIGLDPAEGSDDEDKSKSADEGASSSDDYAADEVRRANRTKFFDIVIPIVPFITHRNARDLMLDEMEGTRVSRDLINVAARFVADMRLITDLRNEYDIYANRLLGGPNQMPGLDEDRLFALVLYKCVHMADFEAIRFGTSDLDRLHGAWRNIVSASLLKAQEQEDAATKQLALDSVLDSRAQALGERLEQVMLAVIPPTNRRHVDQLRLVVGDQVYSGPELSARALWSELVAQREPLSFTNNATGQNLSLSFDRLQVLLGASFSPDEWLAVDRAAEAEKQHEARRNISFLRHHTWSDIHARHDFQSSAEDEQRPETFPQATERILKSRLARALVASGYINDYYALYVSIYYGEHLRPRALNYIVHALDRGVPDIPYALDSEDVESIISDKGIDIFRDRAAYNISILDHLLRNRPTEAEIIVRQIAAADDEDGKFADAYLHGGTEQVAFIRMLASLVPQTILWFASFAPHDVLAEAVDAALDYAGAKIGGPVDDWLIIDHYTEFPSLTHTVDENAEVDAREHRTIDAIARLGVKLPDTAPLNEAARAKVRDLNAYELNVANLADLTGQTSISLDAIRASSTPIYNSTLGRIGEYFDLLDQREDGVSIEDPAAFLPILNEAHNAAVGRDHLEQIVRASAPGCHVDDISDAPPAAWPALAATKRLTPTARNLLSYLDNAGAFDDSLGNLLAGITAVEQPAAASEAERENLATAILGARDVIPAPDQRVGLAKSLNLHDPIPAPSLSPESGTLPALMIQAGLVRDDETTLASRLIPDWTTREVALAHSQNAMTFLSPSSLPTAELVFFFRSITVPAPLKQVALDRLAVFAPAASEEAIQAATVFAVESNTDLPIAVIDQLRTGGASATGVAALLAHSTSVTLEEIRAQLRTLKHPYSSIADRGTLRPTVPDDEPHRRLLDRLRSGGIVSGHKPEHGRRRVTLRRP